MDSAHKIDAYDDHGLPVGSRLPLLLPLPICSIQFPPLVEGLFFAQNSSRRLNLRQIPALSTSKGGNKHDQSPLP